MNIPSPENRVDICPAKIQVFRSSLGNEGVGGVPSPEFFHCTGDCIGPLELRAKVLGVIPVRQELCPRQVVEHFLLKAFV